MHSGQRKYVALMASVKRIEGIKEATLRKYDREISEIESVYGLLFGLSDLGQDIVTRESSGDILYIINRLTILEWCGFTGEIFHGIYWGANRTLRWILESALKGYAATINASILGSRYSGMMDYNQFYKYLTYADQNPRSVNGVSRIIRLLNEPNTAKRIFQHTYRELCKQSHLSVATINRLEKRKFFAKPQLLDDEFKETHKLAFRTIDSMLYLLCKGYAHISKLKTETDGFFRNYFKGLKKSPDPADKRLYVKRVPIMTKFLKNIK